MLLFIVVGGCSVTPQLNKDLAKLATKSYNDLSTLLAKAELGALRSNSSFDKSVDNYAAIVSGYETVRLYVGSSNPQDNSAVGASSSTLGRLIDICLQQVKFLAEAHKASGIKPGSGITQPVRVSCDAATRSITASVR